MALPQMHGRTHIPAGYAAAVQPVSDPDSLIDQASSDQIPCIAAESGGPMDSAYLFQGSGQTILNNSTTNLVTYQDHLSGTDITADETTGKFTVSASGIYLLQLNVLWSGTFAGGKLSRISVAGGGSIAQNIGNPSNSTEMQDTGTNNDFTQVQWLVFASDATPSLLFQGQVRQNSGSSRDVSTVDFSIVRLSAYA